MKKKVILTILIIILGFGKIISVEASENLLKTETDDKVIFVNDENGTFGYSWVFDKKEFNNNSFDFDLGISFKSNKEQEINKIVGNDVEIEYVSFNYHGKLPSDATIKIPVDKTKFKDGDTLKLYYYNEDTKNVEEINSYVKVLNGYVSFEIEHCSDYFLTMSIVKETSSKDSDGSSNGVIIIGMMIVIIGLVCYTLIKNKK